MCITHTVEHNCISPSSTVGIQLHVSAIYVGHLQVEIQLTDQVYKMCVMFFEGTGHWVGGTRSSCYNSGYHDLGLLQVETLLYYKHCLAIKQGVDANITQNIDGH